MFKTGAKFLYGLAAFGFVAAFLFATATGDHSVNMSSLIGPITLGYKGRVGDHLGYGIFAGLGIVAMFLAIVVSAVRDADPEAEAEYAGVDMVPEVEAPRTASYWPIVGAFAAGSLALGLAVSKEFFFVGIAGIAVVTVEWASVAWADRATGDPEVNRAIRGRFMHPVEIPATALLGIGAFVLLISRVLLAVPEATSAVIFGGVPALGLAVGATIAVKPKVSSSVVAGLLLVGGLAVLGGGIAAGVHGHRKIEKYHVGAKGSGASSLQPGTPLVVKAGR
ncbi:MAG TPA: hypothetical protein VGM93_11380 [Acidimicrobiales bacterium]